MWASPWVMQRSSLQPALGLQIRLPVPWELCCRREWHLLFRSIIRVSRKLLRILPGFLVAAARGLALQFVGPSQVLLQMERAHGLAFVVLCLSMCLSPDLPAWGGHHAGRWQLGTPFLCLVVWGWQPAGKSTTSCAS